MIAVSLDCLTVRILTVICAMRRAVDLLAVRARKTYVNPTDIAWLYVVAGEKAQALAWLEKGCELRDEKYPLSVWFPILTPCAPNRAFRTSCAA